MGFGSGYITNARARRPRLSTAARAVYPRAKTSPIPASTRAPATRVMVVRGTGRFRIARRFPAERTEPIDPADKNEATEPAEPIENAEPMEPAEPIERIEPLDPMARIEPSEPSDRIESREANERKPLSFMQPIYPSECLSILPIARSGLGVAGIFRVAREPGDLQPGSLLELDS